MKWLRNIISCFKVPEKKDAERLSALAEAEDEENYLKYAAEAWFDAGMLRQDPLSKEGRILLSELLMHHSFFQSIPGFQNIHNPKNEVQIKLIICPLYMNFYPSHREK